MASSMAVRWGGVSALLLSLSAPAAAQDLGAELSRFLHDDAVATIHFRSYFLDRANPGLRNRPIPNSAAWAAGGWLGYETGWLYDVLKLGAVGYTSQPVWAPADRGGRVGLLCGEREAAKLLGDALILVSFAGVPTALQHRLRGGQLRPDQRLAHLQRAGKHCGRPERRRAG